jgi:GT2 family glycosyltransferase
MNPLVSIIIVNWNGKHLIEECLSSVFNLSYSPVELLVVDNNSTDGSQKYLSGKKGFLLICNKTNLGYAAGNNIGFAAAKGKYCAVLNNDMVVDRDWLNEPVRVLEHNENIGIISCRQMSYWKREKIDGLYHYMAKTLNCRVCGEGETYSENPEYSSSGYVLSANGGSMVIRKLVIDTIGGFDERFFAYYEDLDFAMRAFLCSWECFFVPLAVVYHKGSASFGKDLGKKRYYEWRNRYFILFKYFPWRIINKHLYWIVWNEWRTFGNIVFKIKLPLLYFSIWVGIIKGIRSFNKERKENLLKFQVKEGALLGFIQNRIRHTSL